MSPQQLAARQFNPLKESPMKIHNHRLIADDGRPVRFVATPNLGGVMTPEYLVVHYTAGSSAESAIAWLCNPAARASAHLLIGRDGRLTQLAAFNRIAWHAGRSQWAGRSGVNGFSIGVELDNAGRLDRVGQRWVSPVSRREYADDQVLIASHPHDRPGTPAGGWHRYSAAQLDAAGEVGALLMRHYALRDVLGHQDIAPGRKTDPGPAFPLASLRARLLGGADEAFDRDLARAADHR